MKRAQEIRKEELLQLLQDAENGENVGRSTPNNGQAHDTPRDILTEQELLVRCQNESRTSAEAAFKQLIQRYQGNVYTYVSYHVNDDTAAFQIAEDVFVRAFREISGFHGDTAVNVWLLRLTEEQLRTSLGKGDRGPQPPGLSDRDFADDSTAAGPECQAIRSRLAAYVSDDLDPAEFPLIEKHLDLCSQCWLEYEELKDALEVFEQAFTPAPENLAAHILETLFPKRSLWDRWRGFFTQLKKMNFSVHWMRIVPVAAAAIIVIGLSSYFGMVYSIQRERIRQLEQDLLIASEERVMVDQGQEVPIRTVVIFSGELASKGLSQDVLNALAEAKDEDEYTQEILAALKNPDETITQIFDGNLREIEDTLVENIHAAYGKIQKDELETSKDNTLVIRKMTATIPRNANALISRALKQAASHPSETDESADISMTLVTFYIIKVSSN